MDAVADFFAAYSTTIAFVGINALLGLSVWVTLYAGQLTLGNAAFMAVGAYTAALLGRHLSVPFPLALAAGAAPRAPPPPPPWLVGVRPPRGVPAPAPPPFLPGARRVP